jgi:hypothetical protein
MAWQVCHQQGQRQRHPAAAADPKILRGGEQQDGGTRVYSCERSVRESL